jgi:hypothetical protein
LKKKTDDHEPDPDNQPTLKKENQGFQFETEARAAQRRQQQQQTVKSQRKTTTSSNRRSKSSAAIQRDLANTSSTQHESKSIQQTQPVNTEPKPLTLSERLASIGRITSTLDTTQDETPIESESVQRKN